jgi:hypothetical protein
MPFRASFYEHFGFGNAEQRVEWTVPLALFPRGDFTGVRFLDDPADRAALLAARRIECERGQCDVETTPQSQAMWMEDYWVNGNTFVIERAGGLVGFVHLVDERGPEMATVVVEDWGVDSHATLLVLLRFLASLRDQFSNARLTLPAHVPLNRLLRESQVPHRQVDHVVAAVRPYTRMQMRVLDHKAVLEAMSWPAHVSGRCSVAVRECEQTTSTLTIEVDAGRATVSARPAEADVDCTDVLWASIVSGDLSAREASGWGLIRARSEQAIDLLEALRVGPAPFCQEYF